MKKIELLERLYHLENILTMSDHEVERDHFMRFLTQLTKDVAELDTSPQELIENVYQENKRI